MLIGERKVLAIFPTSIPGSPTVQLKPQQVPSLGLLTLTPPFSASSPGCVCENAQIGIHCNVKAGSCNNCRSKMIWRISTIFCNFFLTDFLT